MIVECCLILRLGLIGIVIFVGIISVFGRATESHSSQLVEALGKLHVSLLPQHGNYEQTFSFLFVPFGGLYLQLLALHFGIIRL